MCWCGNKYEQNKHVPFEVDDRLETIAGSNRGSSPRVKKVVRVDLGNMVRGALFACQLRILRSKERDSTSLQGVN